MNDPSKSELTFAQCRQIMHAEDVPSGRLFANPKKRTMNKPVEYDQEDLVNCELQQAAHRKR